MRIRELVWTCEHCGFQNLGRYKNCQKCGAPQSKDTKFHRPSDGPKEVTDPRLVQMAMNGPDVHCPYCGTRNPNGARLCSQCGGELRGGKIRETGDVDTKEDEGVYHGEYKPPDEEDENAEVDQVFAAPPPTSYPRQRYTPVQQSILESTNNTLLTNIGIGAIVVLLVGIFIWYAYMKWFKVTEVPVTLNSFSWKTEIHIGEIFTYHEGGWSIPPGGRKTGSEERFTGRYYQKQVCEQVSVPKSEQYVCGETCVDLGNGFENCSDRMCTRNWTEMETQCHQEDDYSRPIYETWYFYDIDRWTQTRTVTASSLDNEPYWPEFNLAPGESEGDRTVMFVVNYTDELGETHTLTSYNPTDWDWFVSLSENQVCYADRNGFGDLNDGIDCAPRTE
jgi:hypothetical protein